MLLVRDSMTREVTTVAPKTTAAEALALCREKRFRHLLVMESGDLVGIVSDRDLRSATPALGDPDRAAALQKIQVRSVMSRDVITALPDDPIEQAANEMRERGIGCLPVVDDGKLAGILTTSDVMDALVHLVGAREPGSRLVIAVPDRPGSLAGVAGVFGMCGINIVSTVLGPQRETSRRDNPERTAVFRVNTIDPGEVIGYLKQAGYPVLWPPQAPKA